MWNDIAVSAMAAFEEYGLQRILVIGEWCRASIGFANLWPSTRPVQHLCCECTGNVKSQIDVSVPLSARRCPKSATLHEELAVPHACSCCAVRCRGMQSGVSCCCALSTVQGAMWMPPVLPLEVHDQHI